MSARESHARPDRCLPDDLFFDYLLLPYVPPRPAAGKLRSVNLLLASFGLMGVAEQGRRVVACLQQQLGPFRTVWRIKHTPAAPEPLSWEFYFYRRNGCLGEPTLEGVLGALAPHLQVPAQLELPPRWEVFSVEFEAADLVAGRGSELDVYIGMRAYRAHGPTLELKNVYAFDDPGLYLDRILKRLRVAVHAPCAVNEISRLLPPELLAGCPRVCVANKSRADGLYFSHLRLEQLTFFLATHRWPAEVRQWVDRQAGDLDHLLWDAGFDFCRAGQSLEIPRSALFGFF